MALTGFEQWLTQTKHLGQSTAKLHLRVLRRLITLECDLRTADIEETLLNTVPHYISLARTSRAHYRMAVRYWQEYLTGDTAP